MRGYPSKMIFVDYEKCIGCYTCVVACKMEHNLPPYPSSPPNAEPTGPQLIRVYRVGPEIVDGRVHQYFVAVTCMHCSSPPCMSACPVNAISKHESGIVAVDREKCIGCRFCLWACPYGAPQFNSEGKMMLCDLCLHRLLEGKKAACEAHCPAGCIYVGYPHEISRIIGWKAALKLKSRVSESALKP
ncbi:MAG: 4Fe-4S dicluster domain-containing protein [Candidatus Bathyarchaeota archaeon]|nr:4Fe-4S dicluster domain-containing protein [Candidatus Bathyarchaeota archaeon]